MDNAGIESGGRENVSWRTRLAQSAVRVRSDVSFALIDALVIVVAYSAALVLRFVDLRGVPENWMRGFILALPLVIAVHLGANVVFGAYGHVWEYASVEEAMRLVFATATASVLLISGIVTFRSVTSQPGVMPLTVAAVGSLVALGGMGALRFRSRLFSFKRMDDMPKLVTTLVVGTGRPAAELARHGWSSEHPRNVVGFVTIDDTQQPRRLAGRRVIGALRDVPAIVVELKVDEVVVAAQMSEDELRSLVDGCMHIEVRLRILPDQEEALGDAGQLTDIRDLELDDLLPRITVSTDLTGAAELLAGKQIVVTGAGGSIGSEMVRQLLKLEAKITALDHDETLLHDAMLSWSNADMVTPVLGDVRDEADMMRTFRDLRPDVVFHAAALKHVPILEAHPDQAVKTNILGTANLLKASKESGVSQFVLVSTDKAVSPESVLGASKRIAEMLNQSAAATNPQCKFASVRFGNVLGSRGSVVPTFMEQIRRGGPVTITDPRMTRYFMTVSEAIELVFQAAALTEQGEVFVLDMGEPARIEELAHRMIRLAGLVPGRDIEVIVTGSRPGEKITEILSIEPLVVSPHPKIRIAKPGFPAPATMHDILEVLREEAEAGDALGLRTLLHQVAWQNWQSDERLNLNELEDVAFWT